MFSFDLPLHAAVKVELPTGGSAIMVHVGGGRFISNIPPLVLAGVSTVAGVEEHGLPVAWDSQTLAGNVHSALFAFDTAGAAKAVQDAAAAGDEVAREMLRKMEEAEAMLAAQKAVGLVKDPEAVADSQDSV